MKRKNALQVGLKAQAAELAAARKAAEPPMPEPPMPEEDRGRTRCYQQVSNGSVEAEQQGASCHVKVVRSGGYAWRATFEFGDATGAAAFVRDLDNPGSAKRIVERLKP